MWKPNDSLEDYIGRPTPPVTPDPPPAVSLQRTGEVEVLKPMTPDEVRRKPVHAASNASGRPQPLWFRRFLAVGSAALVMIAFVLVSAILVGINDTTSGPEVATIATPDDNLTQSDEPIGFDVFYSALEPAATERVSIVRSNRFRRAVRPSIRVIAKKPRPKFRPLPQPEEPAFFPTTLVIYAENGVINTRIEPWLQIAEKKDPTFTN